MHPKVSLDGGLWLHAYEGQSQILRTQLETHSVITETHSLHEEDPVVVGTRFDASRTDRGTHGS